MKPRQASASEHAYRIKSRSDLRFFSQYIPEPVVQEMIDGPEITTDVVVGIRPEDLEVRSDGASGIPVTVDFHEPLGSHVLVHAQLGDTSVPIVGELPGIVVQAAPDIRPAPGRRLTLTADPKHIYLFDASTGAALNNDGRPQVVAS